MTRTTHYPTYDVLSEKEAWDEHTRSIVMARTVRERGYRFLTPVEAEMLRAVSSLLAGDDRAEVIQYVLCHIDETLGSSTGEGQRKTGTPPAPELVRGGLAALERLCRTLYTKPFISLPLPDRKQLLGELQEGRLRLPKEDRALPQKELFRKLLSLTIEAYFSHPTVWSEMGYGGPAYPRGYVRTEGNQLDPWEAKKDL